MRHYWITAKLLIAIAVIASAFGFIHRWVVSAAERSAQLPVTGADIAAGGGDLGVQLVTAFGVAVSLVAVATVLSVYKPWGVTPTERGWFAGSHPRPATSRRTITFSGYWTTA